MAIGRTFQEIDAAKRSQAISGVESAVQNLPPGYIQGYLISVIDAKTVEIGAGFCEVAGYAARLSSTYRLPTSAFNNIPILPSTSYHVYIDKTAKFYVFLTDPVWNDSYLAFYHQLYLYRYIGTVETNASSEFYFAKRYTALTTTESLNSLITNINDRLVVGLTGYTAYNLVGSIPAIGDTRIWIDNDELRVEAITAIGSPNTVDNATWTTVQRFGGQEGGSTLASLRAKVFANPNTDLSSFVSTGDGDIRIMPDVGGTVYINGGFLPDGASYDTDWHVMGDAGEPAFEGTWAAGSPSTDPVRFRKDASGNVFLAGFAESGSAGSVIFYLPTGYRPSIRTTQVTLSNGAVSYANVNTDGGVSVGAGTSSVYVTCSFNVGGGYPVQGATGATGPKGDKGDAGTSVALGEYDPAVTYGEQQMCNYAGVLYKKRTGSGSESGVQPDTHPASWAAISGGNTDWSLISSDVALEVGETVELPFASATSVPLHIATGDGTVYEMKLKVTGIASAATATFLYPNNITYTGAMTIQTFYGTGSTAGAASSIQNSFAVGFNRGVSTITIENDTIQKMVSFRQGSNRSGTGLYDYGITTIWNDTTTVWGSLGTISFPSAASGIVVVKRIL